MKVLIAYEVPQQKFSEVEALVAASIIRDIDLNGVDLTVERGEFTCIEETSEEDSIDAAQILHVVNAVIQGIREVPPGRGLTIFNVFYDA